MSTDNKTLRADLTVIISEVFTKGRLAGREAVSADDWLDVVSENVNASLAAIRKGLPEKKDPEEYYIHSDLDNADGWNEALAAVEELLG